MIFDAKMGENATLPSNDQLNENEDAMEEDDASGQEDEDMTPEEFNALSNKMDELNSALDTIEEKNDIIYSELLKLLQANREIRQQMEGQSTDETPQPSAK